MTSKQNIDKAKLVKLVVTDIDGVWTDSKMYYSNKGLHMKAFSTYDGMAATLLKKYNFILAMVTSEYENIEIPKINKKARNTKNIDNPATNNWQKKVAEIRTVIPKSGCINIKAKSKMKKANRIGK